MIQPGEIYMADFAQAGPHPVIVISREQLNRGRYALVAVCTSARFAVRSQTPNCVPFRAGDFGLAVDCVAQCENLLSIDMTRVDLAEGPIGGSSTARRFDRSSKQSVMSWTRTSSRPDVLAGGRAGFAGPAWLIRECIL